jgi:hypothetical protein
MLEDLRRALGLSGASFNRSTPCRRYARAINEPKELFRPAASTSCHQLVGNGRRARFSKTPAVPIEAPVRARIRSFFTPTSLVADPSNGAPIHFALAMCVTRRLRVRVGLFV